MATKMLSTFCLLSICFMGVLFVPEETNAQWNYWYYPYWGKRDAGFGDSKDAPKEFRGLVNPINSNDVRPSYNGDSGKS